MTEKKLTQEDMLKEFYRENPNRDIPHTEVVDWVNSITNETHNINGHIEWHR